MAKLNGIILEIKEKFQLSGMPEEQRKPPKVVLRRFVRIFNEVEDSRKDGMTTYPLVEILLIAFLAVLSNAATWKEITTFGLAKKRWLKKFIPLQNGIPSHDTFRRVFGMIDSQTLQTAIVYFLTENMNAIRRSLGLKAERRLICVDGKEQRGTGRKYGTDQAVRNLQTLHVYDATNAICLYSQPINAKTNEIPVAQDLLKTMDLKDTIVSFDALHTQKETIRTIAEQRGDYVGGLKGNQSGLQEAVMAVFTDARKDNIRGTGKGYYETSEKAHNQIEKRRYYLIPAKIGTEEWANLRSFLCFEKYTCHLVTGKENIETRYYITSLRDVSLAADAVRGHWSVENNLHWHLDYSFQEDDNTTMDKNAFQNLSLMNKMALSLCKLAQPMMKNSIRVIRKNFGWALEDSLSLLLNTFDNSQLAAALESTPQKKK